MRLTHFTSFAFASFLFAACGATPAPRAPHARAPHARASVKSPAAAPVVLSFLGLNDLHGRLRALPAFAGYANNLRRVSAERGGAVALLDAGDMFQGTLESNLSEGATVIAAYQVLGMTVAALGNHEFDFGPAGAGVTGDPQGAIRARISEASFPILSANLVLRGSEQSPSWDKFKRSVIVTLGGVRVGFVGLLTRETPSIVQSAWFAGLDVAPLAPALIKEARSLREQGAEVVIAVAHAGGECKDFRDPEKLESCTSDSEIFELARALPVGTVNAIFAGHTHAGVAQIVNGVPIVEAYSLGRAFSRIDLRLDGSHHILETKLFPPHDLCPELIDGGSCALSDYEGAKTTEDPEVARAIAPALARADQLRETPIGSTLSEAITGEHSRESALGNLFADLLREAVVGADASVINGGCLRADLPAGELSYGRLFEAMPFDNLVAQIRVTGAELKAVIRSHLAHDAHGLISLSGLRVDARCGQRGVELTLRRNNGRPVADRETLLIATSDYLATGGDNLFAPLKLPPGRIEIDRRTLFRDALALSLSRHPRLSPRDPAIFDVDHPRLTLSSPRPLVCTH